MTNDIKAWLRATIAEDSQGLEPFAALLTIEALEGQLAECYRLTGADPDGNEDWRLAPLAVAEVKRLRAESDGQRDGEWQEICLLRAKVEALEGERDVASNVSGELMLERRDLRAQLAARDAEIKELQAKNRFLGSQVGGYKSRATTLEAQKAEIARLEMELRRPRDVTCAVCGQGLMFVNAWHTGDSYYCGGACIATKAEPALRERVAQATKPR